jgi:hypothetical protein
MSGTKRNYVLCNINVMSVIGTLPPSAVFVLFELLKVMDEAGSIKITHAHREEILRGTGLNMKDRQSLCVYMSKAFRKLIDAGFLMKDNWSTYRVNPLFFKGIGAASKHAVKR